MADREAITKQIDEAFAGGKYPGDWCLQDSNEGDESFLLEEEFKGKDDWRALNSSFLDQAPDGFSSALSFFSVEAFRFYLPAYLIADLRNELKAVDVVFRLTHGLDDSSRYEQVNPLRYGERTWFEEARYKFAVFSQAQVSAIVAYLKAKLDSDDLVDLERASIEQSLMNYWLTRKAGEKV